LPKILFSHEAQSQYKKLQTSSGKQRVYKAVRKTLGLMEVDLRHPSLNTHQYHSLKGPGGEKVFEAYAQNKTPGAYRVFWCYGPEKDEITILAMTPHP